MDSIDSNLYLVYISIYMHILIHTHISIYLLSLPTPSFYSISISTYPYISIHSHTYPHLSLFRFLLLFLPVRVVWRPPSCRYDPSLHLRRRGKRSLPPDLQSQGEDRVRGRELKGEYGWIRGWEE